MAVVTKRLGELGVDVRTSALVVGDDGANILVERGDDTDKIPASHVLVAVGRRPNTDDLQLEDAGIVPADDGLIVVDEQQRVVATPNVFAIGDVTAGPALAHRASEQGRVAAEAMCGLPSAFDQLVPMVAFCDPELAAVGLSERDAAASGTARRRAGEGSFAVNGRALTLGEADGPRQAGRRRRRRRGGRRRRRRPRRVRS